MSHRKLLLVNAPPLLYHFNFKKLKLKLGKQFSRFVSRLVGSFQERNSITIYLHKIHEGSVDHSDSHR